MYFVIDLFSTRMVCTTLYEIKPFPTFMEMHFDACTADKNIVAQWEIYPSVLWRLFFLHSLLWFCISYEHVFPERHLSNPFINQPYSKQCWSRLLHPVWINCTCSKNDIVDLCLALVASALQNCSSFAFKINNQAILSPATAINQVEFIYFLYIIFTI